MMKKQGRPQKYPGTYVRNINIAIPQSLIPSIDSAVRAKGGSRSALVVAIIAAHLGESAKYQSDFPYPSNVFISYGITRNTAPTAPF